MDLQQIRELFNSGLTRNEQIAKLLGWNYSTSEIISIMKCSPNTVSKIRTSLKQTGSPPDQAKVGRPTKRTPQVSGFITQATLANPYISSHDLKEQIHNSFNISIGETTVNSMRSEAGFVYLPPIKEPSLTQIQIRKRIDFCYTILLHKDELPNIGFSDESRFSLGSDKRWLWRRRGEYNPNSIKPHVKYPTTIMIWAMISKNYKPSIFIYDTTENKENYTDMLYEKSYLLDALTFFEGDFLFQQDGATPHTAKYTMDSISEICDVMINWPPNSPDLNIIEMIWSLMEKTINFYSPQNKEELKDAIKYAWNAISIETINKLYDSFIRKCFICLENHGKCINQYLQKTINYDVTNEEIDLLFSQLEKDGIVLNEIEIIRHKIE